MEPFNTKIKAIIFDMDGTIIKTEDAWRQVNLELLAHYGFTQFSPEQQAVIDSFHGMAALITVVTLIKEHFNIDDSVELIIAKKIEIANRKLADHVEFVEGFKEFHNRLSSMAIPTSIATNAVPENLEGLAQRLDFGKFFGTNMYCAAHVGNKPKPDPALFLHAAQMLGVKPEECLVFEDSAYGFQAAQAAGMKCIAIKTSYNEHLLDQVNDAIMTYHEAEEAIKKL